jgi:hypothetical protein
MTKKLTLFVSKLEATADPRVKTGLLLPYTEPGLTSLGKVTASKGSLRLAERPDPLTLEHKDKLPVADFVSMEEEDEGLRCSVRYLDTPLGNAALEEFETGKRAGLSVEVDQPVIRAGRLTAGIVTGGSQVEEPAFPSARLVAAEEPDAPDMGEAEPDNLPRVVINGEALENVSDVTVSEEEIDIKTTDAEDAAPVDTEGNAMTAAKVQNPALVAVNEPKHDKNALFAALAKGFANGETFTTPKQLEAALSDIIPANWAAATQPQYVGQLWDGQPYERRFIPLFNHSDLTAQTVTGWQWKDGKRPEVDLYTGNKADIPSNDIDTEAATGVLQRIAGGHDIDRIYRDFGSAEFWDRYFAAMTESYAKKSDRYVRDVVKAIPTVANGGRVHLLNSAMPSGVPKALAMVVKGALKILNSDLEVMPTFALIAASYWEELFYVPQEQVLAYLSASLSLKEGQVSDFKLVPVPDDALTVGGWVGKVLVGHKNAVTVSELPGSPIRVEAEAIAKGGVDEALFGYVHTLTENVKGLVAFDAPTAS